jgi:hypothetical protein
MPTYGSFFRDYSKEWKYWTKHYEDMGCSYNKVLELVYRRKKQGKLNIPNK